MIISKKDSSRLTDLIKTKFARQRTDLYWDDKTKLDYDDLILKVYIEVLSNEFNLDISYNTILSDELDNE